MQNPADNPATASTVFDGTVFSVFIVPVVPPTPPASGTAGPTVIASASSSTRPLIPRSLPGPTPPYNCPSICLPSFSSASSGPDSCSGEAPRREGTSGRELCSQFGSIVRICFWVDRRNSIILGRSTAPYIFAPIDCNFFESIGGKFVASQSEGPRVSCRVCPRPKPSQTLSRQGLFPRSGAEICTW